MTQQAIETSIETTPIVQPGSEGASRADLIAALEGVDLTDAPAVDPAAAPGATQTPLGTPAVEPQVPPGGAVDPAEPEVVRQIRAREKAEQTRAEARSEAEQLRIEARAEAAKILQEARDAAVRDAQAAREAFARDFREKPLSAIRGAGIDPGRLVSDVTAEGTPEFERQRAAEARILAAEARAQKAEDAAGGAHKAIEAQQEQIAAWHRQQAEREFVGLVPSTSALHRAADEASKALANIGVAQSREQILIQRAHAAADTIKAAGGVASPSNVVQYLEWEASQRLTPAQGAQATATEPTGRANGTTRTLSAAGASERRSAPKPMDELSPREQRALLVAEADAVLRGK